jgi:5,10-methylenetetrahydromethanopterin reductase
MEIGTVFGTSVETPEHIRAAEELGYEYAFVYDSPTFLADPWIVLARAAELTSRIRIGVGVITPRLRHVVANAGATATLHTLVPGRVDLGVGAGFTSQAMLGKKPARWAEVEEYIRGLRALLAGEELEWDGEVIALRHGTLAGVRLPAHVPIWVAAHGPKGYAVAERVADAVLTNLGHGSTNVVTELNRVFLLHYGTVLEEDESLASERVLQAAGPAAALHLHLGSEGAAGDMEEPAAYHEQLSTVDERRRHLEMHRGHLIEVTDLERPFVTPALIKRATGTGTSDEVREQLVAMGQAGATGVLYGAMGPDIPNELRKFADVARSLS